MSPTSERTIVVLLAIAVALAVVALLVGGGALGPGDEPRTQRHEQPAARPANDRGATARSRPGERPVLIDPAASRAHGDEDARDAGLAGGGDGGSRAGFRLAKLFEGDCQFGVNAHCREWGERAARCDEGDARACVELGDLLIGESPMQPLWGSLLLQRACELGRDDVCERATQWNEWSRYGYSPKGGDDTVPEELAARCDDGDLVACGLIDIRRSRRPW